MILALRERFLLMNIAPISSFSTAAATGILNSRQNSLLKTQRSMAKLATGLKILGAYDDPSGLAQSERLRSIAGRYEAALNNVDNAASFINTSDGYLQGMHNITGRMEELAVAANDGTKSDADRAALQAEFSQLQGALRDITGGSAPLASYNGNEIFDGSSVTMAVGPEPGQELTVGGNDLRPGSAEVIGQAMGGGDITWGSIIDTGGGIDISTQSGANDAVHAMNLASSHITGIRTNMGAQQSRLQQSRMGISAAQTNTIMAEGRIRNADYAREIVNFNNYMNLGSLATGVLGNMLAVG